MIVDALLLFTHSCSYGGLDFHFPARIAFALYHFVITDRTTKRTIMENEQMTTELQYQSLHHGP